ncbi:MAG: methyltransferase domain-containing protein [Candidatus Scalindua sediminis]|nr:methyltransferase domain-containing protein [Candidatus Scalindua sediminis]
MRKDLKKMRTLYDEGVNIIKHIKKESQSDKNSSEMITISYDLQSGNYIKKALEYPEWEDEYSNIFAKVLNQLGEYDSILEVGVGEATTLNNILSRISNVPSGIFGFDISYSRIQYAMNYLKKKNVKNSTLFMGDLFNAAILDNSIDVVYTSHSLEPNGGREAEALSELYRITKKYLVLFEPSHELADSETKSFMEQHGFVKNLYSTAVKLGYKVIEHKLLIGQDPISVNKNNTAVLVIEKINDFNSVSPSLQEIPLACPITKAPLELIRNNYYCKESLLLYPIADQIPCLLPENAIIATHYMDDFEE